MRSCGSYVRAGGVGRGLGSHDRGCKGRGGGGGDGRQGNGKGDKKVMGKEYKEIWAQGKKEIGGGGGMGNWESGNVTGMPETLYH